MQVGLPLLVELPIWYYYLLKEELITVIPIIKAIKLLAVRLVVIALELQFKLELEQLEQGQQMA